MMLISYIIYKYYYGKNTILFINIIMEKTEKRIKVKRDGVEVYEWEQNLEEVILYFKKSNILYIAKDKSSKISLNIKADLIEISFKEKGDNIVSFRDNFSKKVRNSESIWEIENDILTITLVKALKGEMWKSVFDSDEQINTLQEEEIKKLMLKERFQEEHKGFDFSDAQINGNVPNAKDFMGGLKYS